MQSLVTFVFSVVGSKIVVGSELFTTQILKDFFEK